MFSAHYSLKAKLMFMHQISNNPAENINHPHQVTYTAVCSNKSGTISTVFSYYC